MFTNSRHARVHRPPRSLQVACAHLKRQSKPGGIPCSPMSRHARIHHPPRGLQVACPQLTHQSKDPICPTLRANPFPKVTDLFCQLPLPTLFYGPEAAHLRDLMQVWVRMGVRVSLSFSLSRAMGSMPDTSEDKLPCAPVNPSSRQSDFRVRDS